MTNFDELAKNITRRTMSKKSSLLAEEALQIAGAMEHSDHFQRSVGRTVENQVFLEVADPPTPQPGSAEVAAPAQEGVSLQQFEFLLNRYAKSCGSVGIVEPDPSGDVG